jgi:hypothetical protein
MTECEEKYDFDKKFEIVNYLVYLIRLLFLQKQLRLDDLNLLKDEKKVKLLTFKKVYLVFTSLLNSLP